MCVPSLKKVDPDVPEFGNEMVTDYQQTDMYKVICTLFFERGHNKKIVSLSRKIVKFNGKKINNKVTDLETNYCLKSRIYNLNENRYKSTDIQKKIIEKMDWYEI